MTLSAGDRLGPYEILERIGAGGMGEVYRARDTRLNRDVAIKLSAAQFSERFEREARAVAALNHPNICHIYDVGAAQNAPGYIVMEYVEGAPIAPLDTPRKLLDLAVQIADGLAAAHAAGVVHRDLKPDNILVTRDGRAKILDFGIAKTAAAAATADATVAMTITDPGTTLGTIHYMSPEQARGAPNLGPQSDQFSLGIVLYELAAGKRPFARPSAAETMTAIIREDAEPLPASTPAPLRWIIERLLSKDPADRYDSTRDLYRELRQIRDRYSESVSSTAAAQASATRLARRRFALPWILAAGSLALVAGAALAIVLLPASPNDLSAYKFTALSRQDATERTPAWSPDGKSIAFILNVHGVDQVFIKAIDSLEATQLTHGSTRSMLPFWSRDGSQIYYISPQTPGLCSVPVSGGTPEKHIERAGNFVSLHPDGKTVLLVRQQKLYVGSVQGGEPREFRIPALANRAVIRPQFAPDGAKFSVSDGNALWIVKYPSATATKIENVNPRELSWMPDSRRLIYLEDAGNQNRLLMLDTEDRSVRVIYASHGHIVDPAVSPDGKRLIYVAAPTEWDVLEIAVPSAQVRTVMAESGVSSSDPDWHPSGTHFLVDTNHSGIQALEDVSAAEGFFRRIQSGTGVSTPRFSPDGARFLFWKTQDGRAQLMISSLSGAHVMTIDPEAVPEAGYDWSPDGQWIVYGRTHEGKAQLVKRRPGSTADPIVISEGEGDSPFVTVKGGLIRWSPTGDWILHPRSSGLWLISPEGKQAHQLTPRKFPVAGFSRDGGQVIAVQRDTSGQGPQWTLYSVDVKTGAAKLLGPIDLPVSTDTIAGFSMHPDGKRFLTSIAKWPFDIWMLEGFDAPPKSWLDRLLRR